MVCKLIFHKIQSIYSYYKIFNIEGFIRFIFQSNIYDSNFKLQIYFYFTPYLLLLKQMKSLEKDINDELKFSCTSQNQKGTIKAVLSKLNAQYIGQISSSVDIQDLAEALEKRQYKILQQSLEVLKIKVGPVKIVMNLNLKAKLNHLQKENSSLRIKNKLLYNIVSILDPMSLPYEDIKWSQYLKEEDIEIDQKIVKRTKRWGSFHYALLQVGFSLDVKRKQFWAIKSKTPPFRKPFRIGIYLKKQAQLTLFNLSCQSDNENDDSSDVNPQYGCYFISSDGKYTGYDQDRQDQLIFKFNEGDIIYLEYNPVDWKLRFIKNTGEEKFEMRIEPPPAGDAYHPCVEFQERGQSAELISSTALVSWNQVFKLFK